MERKKNTHTNPSIKTRKHNFSAVRRDIVPRDPPGQRWSISKSFNAGGWRAHARQSGRQQLTAVRPHGRTTITGTAAAAVDDDFCFNPKSDYLAPGVVAVITITIARNPAARCAGEMHGAVHARVIELPFAGAQRSIRLYWCGCGRGTRSFDTSQLRRIATQHRN